MHNQPPHPEDRQIVLSLIARRLLREAYKYLYHHWEIPNRLLAEIREAIEEKP